MKNVENIICIILILTMGIGCNKANDFLDQKQVKSDVVPKRSSDFQAFLDNDAVMNSQYPGLGFMGADNYYLLYSSWQAVTHVEQNAYLWQPDIFQGQTCSDWDGAYQIVSISNTALDGAAKYQGSDNDASWNNVKGSAYFFRAFAFYNLAQTFAKPYSPDSATVDLGIPLPLTFDPTIKAGRSTVQQTYDQVIKDLMHATSLLPPTPQYQNRPSLGSANALLARVYLNMGLYDSSLKYSSASLTINNKLLDYNQIDSTSYNPFPAFGNNPEILFYAISVNYEILYTTYYSLVDSNLFASYDMNDLRRPVFYLNGGPGNITFKGSYMGSYICFAGLGVDEEYITRAECYARKGDVANALADLNALLITRWRAGTFVPLTAPDAPSTLDLVLSERRKELPFTTNIRWEDLRRLNKDPQHSANITRILNGQTYTLLPNSNEYVYPIPPDEIKYNHIPQNPR